MKVLGLFGPILLLIGVMWLFMRGAAQRSQRAVDAVAESNSRGVETLAEMRRQSEALERIATALED